MVERAVEFCLEKSDDLRFDPFLQEQEQQAQFGPEVDFTVEYGDMPVNSRSLEIDDVLIPAVVDVEPFGQVLGQVIGSPLGVLAGHRMVGMDINDRHTTVNSELAAFSVVRKMNSNQLAETGSAN